MSSLRANIPPPLDLTPYINKGDSQYVSGGSFGDVYRCWCNHDSPKEVAIKAFRFKTQGTSDRSANRELGVWRRLEHPNVVPFLGVASGFGMHGAMSLVSLWMPNESLHSFLAKHGDDLDLERRLRFLLDIANGLYYLHSFPFVHGDLNCNNVLLDADYTARLADFGYASLVGNIPEAPAYLQRSTTRPGALRWSAPEQLNPEKSRVTPESDVYSFGCVVLKVLTGKPPWSEIQGKRAVALQLASGHKPGRPASRILDNSHWMFIQHCWAPANERPTAEVILPTIQRFLRGNRVRSKRCERRMDANKITLLERSSLGTQGAVTVFGAALEPVAPLEMSPNRLVATSTLRTPGATDTDSPAFVDRKVRALLNKLTIEKFDSISDQIISWANKSENGKDGQTLIHVTRLVVESATNGAAWSEVYARLCRKMMETISPKVQVDGVGNAKGKPITSGQLFRKYLLSRCQDDFERGWVSEETIGAEAAPKATDDQVIKATNEKKGEGSRLYSDKDYAIQKAKRRGLGLIKFLGELFKTQMLTERIIHECVKKLLGNVEDPQEEEIEGLCQLLKTVGQLLDVPKARAHMEVYFTRMKELSKSRNVSPRVQFILQDVIELRDRKWVARGAVIVPTTISAVHEAAAKEKAAAEAQNQRHYSTSQGGSRRGGKRNVESGPRSWTTAGDSVTRPQPRAGDLSQFSKMSRVAPMAMGPSSLFTKDSKHDSQTRTNSSSNIFTMPNQHPGLVDTTAKSGRPPSRKHPVDVGQSGAPKPQRKKLQLLPRTKPTPTKETSASVDEPEALVQMMSEASAKKKIDEDVKEFFAVRSMEEADVYFTNLPEEHRFRLVDKLVGSALESKEADAVLVAEFFAQVASKGQCSPEVFEAGFMPMAELLDDIAIDAPNAFKFMAIMLKGAGFDKDEERLVQLTGKSMESDKLLQLVLL